MNGNRKLFRKKVTNAKGRNVKSCRKMKDGKGRLAQGEGEVRRSWKEYFENLYNII